MVEKEDDPVFLVRADRAEKFAKNCIVILVKGQKCEELPEEARQFVDRMLDEILEAKRVKEWEQHCDTALAIGS